MVRAQAVSGARAAKWVAWRTVGAVAIGDWVYVAGGGAVLGGSVQSAVHEAFTMAG